VWFISDDSLSHVDRAAWRQVNTFTLFWGPKGWEAHGSRVDSLHEWSEFPSLLLLDRVQPLANTEQIAMLVVRHFIEGNPSAWRFWCVGHRVRYCLGEHVGVVPEVFSESPGVVHGL
jgi:hypothetical protein